MLLLSFLSSSLSNSSELAQKIEYLHTLKSVARAYTQRQRDLWEFKWALCPVSIKYCMLAQVHIRRPIQSKRAKRKERDEDRSRKKTNKNNKNNTNTYSVVKRQQQKRQEQCEIKEISQKPKRTIEWESSISLRHSHAHIHTTYIQTKPFAYSLLTECRLCSVCALLFFLLQKCEANSLLSIIIVSYLCSIVSLVNMSPLFIWGTARKKYRNRSKHRTRKAKKNTRTKQF